jgi:hypothetical protein
LTEGSSPITSSSTQTTTTPPPPQTLTDEIDFTEGMEIDRGFVSPYFIKDQETQLCELENPRVLITDRKITNMQVRTPPSPVFSQAPVCPLPCIPLKTRRRSYASSRTRGS